MPISGLSYKRVESSRLTQPRTTTPRVRFQGTPQGQEQPPTPVQNTFQRIVTALGLDKFFKKVDNASPPESSPPSARETPAAPKLAGSILRRLQALEAQRLAEAASLLARTQSETLQKTYIESPNGAFTGRDLLRLLHALTTKEGHGGVGAQYRKFFPDWEHMSKAVSAKWDFDKSKFIKDSLFDMSLTDAGLQALTDQNTPVEPEQVLQQFEAFRQAEQPHVEQKIHELRPVYLKRIWLRTPEATLTGRDFLKLLAEISDSKGKTDIHLRSDLLPLLPESARNWMSASNMATDLENVRFLEDGDRFGSYRLTAEGRAALEAAGSKE